MTLILGIDPGTRVTGYGLIQKDKTNISHVHHGRIKLSIKDSLPDRLRQLYRELEKILQDLEPDTMAIEDVFYAQNVRSMAKLGESRGVAILAARNRDISVFEYAARQVKQAVTGYGSASKEQVQKMVLRLLNLKGELPEDAADALAIAICHSQTRPMKESA